MSGTRSRGAGNPGTEGLSDLSPERIRLIVITDRDLAGAKGVLDTVSEALAGGAPCVQLRDKGRSIRESLPLARALREETNRAGALFFVNDRLDLALAVEADGVHLGPDDLPLDAVARIRPPGFLLGYSTDDPEDAARAQAHGASYIGCGTVFPTASKADAGEVIGLEGLRRVVQSVDIPVVGIGGVHFGRAPQVARSGAAGAAVIGAVMGTADPARSVTNLLRAWEGD